MLRSQLTEATSKITIAGDTSKHERVIAELRAELQKIKTDQGDQHRDANQSQHEITELRFKLDAVTKEKENGAVEISRLRQ